MQSLMEQKSLDILGSSYFQFGEIHLQQTILFHVFQSEQIRFGFVQVQKPKLETRARPNQLKLEQVEPFQFELSEGIGGVVASATGLVLLRYYYCNECQPSKFLEYQMWWFIAWQRIPAPIVMQVHAIMEHLLMIVMFDFVLPKISLPHPTHCDARFSAHHNGTHSHDCNVWFRVLPKIPLDPPNPQGGVSYVESP